jgi:methionine salvage enolase-phosphatase E1
MCLAQLMTKVQATQDLAQQTIAKSVKDKCMTQLKNKVQVTKELAEQTIAKSNKDKCLSELQGRFLYSIFAPRAQQVTSPVSNDQLAADDKTLWWSDPTTPLFIKKSAAIQQQQDNFLMGRQSKFGV